MTRKNSLIERLSRTGSARDVTEPPRRYYISPPNLIFNASRFIFMWVSFVHILSSKNWMTYPNDVHAGLRVQTYLTVCPTGDQRRGQTLPPTQRALQTPRWPRLQSPPPEQPGGHLKNKTNHIFTPKLKSSVMNQFFSLPPEKPRGALTKIRDLSKDLTKGLRKDLSASSSTIVKPRNSNNLFGDRKPMSSLNGGSHPSINSSTRWLFCSTAI